MRKTVGVTLIEQLFIITILAIIVFFSVCSLRHFQEKNQMQKMLKEVSAIINFSRMQSIIEAKNLALTPLSLSDDWSNGAVLFVDNKMHRCGENCIKIHEWRWNARSVDIRWQGFLSKKYLMFSSSGGQNATNGRFYLKNPSGQFILTVNRLARTRVDV